MNRFWSKFFEVCHFQPKLLVVSVSFEKKRTSLNYSRFGLKLLSFFLLVSTIGCQSKETPSKDIDLSKTPINWVDSLKSVTTFTEETNLLAQLITSDSLRITHQRLIGNRLQTFDFRHLGATESSKILDLYQQFLQDSTQLSPTVKEAAFAKLTFSYPTKNDALNLRLRKLLDLE
ncbi:MAG: hypothetical protein AAF960_20795 [Bacteroidota bacterium]